MSDQDKLTLLHSFDSPYHARVFGDYLQSKGIAAELFKAGNGVGIGILDPTQFHTSHLLLREFLSDPSHPRYQDASWETGEVFQGNILTHLKLKELFTPLGVLKGTVTSTVLALCVFVFLCLFVFGYQQLYFDLQFAPVERLSQSGQWWRLITPAFMHFSLAHILFNVLFWWILGNQIENKLGPLWLIGLLLVTGVLSNYG